MCEKDSGIIEAATASIWLNISSTHPNCINFVRALAVREIVEAIVNLCVRSQSGQKGVEVGLVGTICCVVAFVVHAGTIQEAWLGGGLRIEYNKQTKKRNYS